MNQEINVSNSNNKVLIMIVVILIVLVLCLGGYLVYDKLLSNNNDNDITENNNADTDQQKEIKTYSVGDTVTFNNQNWYVISSSNSDMDYVTVISENNQKDNFAYSTSNSSDYETSDLKAYFEQTYMKELGESNLKLVNGYKIRAITKDELVSLGCTTGIEYENIYEDGNCNLAPEWIKGVYWTMTPNEKLQGYAWYIDSNGYGAEFGNNTGVGSTMGARAVINLLKSSIQ